MVRLQSGALLSLCSSLLLLLQTCQSNSSFYLPSVQDEYSLIVATSVQVVTSSGYTGSGTIISAIKGKQARILTAGHLFQENATYYIRCRGIGSFDLVPVVVIKHDKEADLMLLETISELSFPENIRLEVIDYTPKQGSRISVAGYPEGLGPILVEGLISGFILLQDTGNYVHYLLSIDVDKGSSGSSVWYKGKLVGVVVRLKTKLVLSPDGLLALPSGVAIAVGSEALNSFLGNNAQTIN